MHDRLPYNKTTGWLSKVKSRSHFPPAWLWIQGRNKLGNSLSQAFRGPKWAKTLRLLVWKLRIQSSSTAAFEASRRGQAHKRPQQSKVNFSKQFQCPTCPARFFTKSALSVHLRTHDPAGKAFKCAHCDYKSNQQGILNIHVKALHETSIKLYRVAQKICNIGFLNLF